MAARRVLANLLCTERSNGLEELRRLAAEGSFAAMREVVDTAKATIKEKSTVPSVKLRALQALDVCVQVGREDLVAYTAKKVLLRLYKLASYHSEQDNEARGSTLFGTWNTKETAASVHFLLILLDCLRTWAQLHPTLAGSESLYRKTYLKLYAKVTFPHVANLEEQELLQTQQEIALAQQQLETGASRAILAPVITSLKRRLGTLEKALQQPSKRAMQMLDAVERLREVLSRIYERYPEEGVTSVIPAAFVPIPEPSPLQSPKCKPGSTPQPQLQADTEALLAIINRQELLIAQQKAQIQELQMQIKTLREERTQSPERKMTGRESSSFPLSLDNSFLRASDCRQSWSEDLACDINAINIPQARSCMLQQSGLLYEGSLRVRFEWRFARFAVLYVTNCINEVLTNVTVFSVNSDVKCEGITPHLRPDTEATFELRLQNSQLPCWLAALKLTYTGTVGLCSLNLAIPIGPTQAVTRTDMTAEECAAVWTELKPFQTVRRIGSLRSDLRSMQALADVISFKGSFQVLSGADWPPLGSSALLLHGRAMEKAVVVSVSLANSSGCAVAVRVANVRLREALAASFEAAIAAAI